MRVRRAPCTDACTAVDNSEAKFSWAVDSSLGKDKTYGIQITLEADKTVFQYSMPFHITGGNGGGGSHSNGTATYTLSSTTKSDDYSTGYPTLKPTGNYTTHAPPPGTTIYETTTGNGGGSGSQPTKTGGQTVPTSGARALSAPFAFLGAALAAFAL